MRSGDLKRVRSGDATATLLADGRVLVTGGGSLAAPFSETYDPATEQWTIGENLLVGRRGHTGTLLADGRVLVAGGFVCCTGDGQIFTDAAEIYDPTTGTFQLTAPLRQARGPWGDPARRRTRALERGLRGGGGAGFRGSGRLGDLRSDEREVLLGRGTCDTAGGPFGAPAARWARPGSGGNEERRPGTLGRFRDRALRRAHREMDGGPSIWTRLG